jgi:hypothetical protein
MRLEGAHGQLEWALCVAQPDEEWLRMGKIVVSENVSLDGVIYSTRAISGRATL